VFTTAFQRLRYLRFLRLEGHRLLFSGRAPPTSSAGAAEGMHEEIEPPVKLTPTIGSRRGLAVNAHLEIFVGQAGTARAAALKASAWACGAGSMRLRWISARVAVEIAPGCSPQGFEP